MRMCQDHWGKLKAAIESRGLGALIADDGPDVVERMRRDITLGATLDTFEPLMGAHNAILSNALNVGGLQVMAPNEDDAERCPLCWLTAMHDEHCEEDPCDGSPFEGWIDKAADDQVKAWKAFSE